jgi:hypothetical protein
MPSFYMVLDSLLCLSNETFYFKHCQNIFITTFPMLQGVLRLTQNNDFHNDKQNKKAPKFCKQTYIGDVIIYQTSY